MSILSHLKSAKLICLLSACLLACATALAAGGPQAPSANKAAGSKEKAKPSDHITNLELKHFDEFLDKRADIRRDLIKDPKLVDNPDYLVNHPDLDSFLKAHGGVKGELLNHPQEFIAREQQYERAEDRSEGRKKPDHITNLELKHFDEFLDKHADIRKDLTRDPKLADNPDYLVNHPDLDAFLKAHGGVKGELLNHPQEFMQREQQYEKKEKH